MTPVHETHESRQRLIMLTAGPVVWALHFLLSYATVAIWCEKVAAPGGPLGSARGVLAIYTAVALALIGGAAWYGYRRHSFGEGDPPDDYDHPGSRHRFLGFATLLLASLSAVATIYAALAIALIRTCE